MILCLWNAADGERDSPLPSVEAAERLRKLEKQAWDTYTGIAGSLPTRAADEAPDEYLTSRVMPAFKKIGCDEMLLKKFFSLASKAWETLRPASDRVIPLRPDIQRDIDAVRQGLLDQADRKIAIPPGAGLLAPHDNYDRLKAYMDPANLQQLFEDITTPWIILPRANTMLQRDHANYLPAYLEVINHETNEQVLNIFTRIAIEFLANFTIKYADEQYSREQVVKLVVAGYEALFWRNLNTPPRGFEDIRIFEHFLTWMRHSNCPAAAQKRGMDATIREMECRKAAIFPSGPGPLRNDETCRDISCFLVALRHGCIGIDCAVHYFRLPPVTTHWPRGWTILVFALKSLFELVAARYAEESKRTQYYIREFLFMLRKSYAHSVLTGTGPEEQSRVELRTLRSKMIAMLQKAQNTLSTIPT